MSELTNLFGSRLTSAYNSLRGELGAPQGAVETIDKLVDRIQTSAAVEDRRTAVMGLKGLSRDWKEVSNVSLNVFHISQPGSSNFFAIDLAPDSRLMYLLRTSGHEQWGH